MPLRSVGLIAESVVLGAVRVGVVTAVVGAVMEGGTNVVVIAGTEAAVAAVG